MSADNWADCPNCFANVNTAKDRARKSYGKVSLQEYERLLKEVEEAKPKRSTLREDYEIYVGIKGEFHVGYSCSCDQCGFEFRYKHEQQVPLKEKR